MAFFTSCKSQREKYRDRQMAKRDREIEGRTPAVKIMLNFVLPIAF